MKHATIAMSAFVCLLLMLSACKSDTPATPPRTDIRLDSNAQVGNHIVDKSGRSLYYFASDVSGTNNCTGGCATNWLAFLADSAGTYSDGLLASDFATISITGGGKQTTYKGWPLYYYTPGGTAELAGETKGEGVGNVWFVAKASYSIMIANTQLTGINAINYLNNYAPGNGSTNYLVDEKGIALYFFTRDSAFKNKYTRPDFTNNATWPLYETDAISVPSTFDRALFVPSTFNGRKQLTYKGWPLYYFGLDNNVRGSNKGITIPGTQPVGSVWPVATKDAVLAPRL